MSHRIRQVKFVPRTNDGPLECDCGDTMQASKFAAHRTGNGLSANQGLHVLRVPEGQHIASVWNRIKPETRRFR